MNNDDRYLSRSPEKPRQSLRVQDGHNPITVTIGIFSLAIGSITCIGIGIRSLFVELGGPSGFGFYPSAVFGIVGLFALGLFVVMLRKCVTVSGGSSSVALGHGKRARGMHG